MLFENLHQGCLPMGEALGHLGLCANVRRLLVRVVLILQRIGAPINKVLMTV